MHVQENSMHSASDPVGLSITRRKFLRSSALSVAALPAVSSLNASSVGGDLTEESSFAPNPDFDTHQALEVSAETGYSIGASGVGAALLHVHLAESGKYRAILPDNPFPDKRLT
jgi:hypothetical protein